MLLLSCETTDQCYADWLTGWLAGWVPMMLSLSVCVWLRDILTERRHSSAQISSTAFTIQARPGEIRGKPLLTNYFRAK